MLAHSDRPLQSNSLHVWFQTNKKTWYKSWDSSLPSGRIRKSKVDWCVCLLHPHTKRQYSEAASHFNRYHFLLQLLTMPNKNIVCQCIAFSLYSENSLTLLLLLCAGLAAIEKNLNNNPPDAASRLWNWHSDLFLPLVSYHLKGWCQPEFAWNVPVRSLPVVF